MARKQTIDNIFQKTETATKVKPVEEPKKTPLSVYLTKDQKMKIAEIAAELGESNHYVMRYAINEFLKRWGAREYQVISETVTKKTIVSK